MKINTHPLRHCILFALVATLTSCQGQQPSNPQTKERSEPTVPVIPANKEDHDPYFVETKYITSDHGPKSITRNILQAKDGTIWLASWEGILSYDGSTFTNHTNKDSLRRWHVFAVTEDSRGNTWFGTIGAGLYVLMGGNAFENLDTTDGLAYNRTSCIYEDRDGRMWIGTERGISRFDGQSFANFYSPEGGDSDDINTIIQDESGRYWIGSRGSAHTFDGWNTFTKITREDGSPFTNVRSIIMDREGDIWLGGNDGLWRYNGETFSQIESNFTGYIFQDRTGNIWTSSAAENPDYWRISRYDHSRILSDKLTPEVILEEQNMFFGLEEDNEGGIWIGHGRGVYRYDGSQLEKFK